MTLLLTIFAAVITTIIWYCSEKARKLKCGILCYMFWGAGIMWFIDAIAEYMELKAEYFTPSIEDMINDSFLGLSVIALALIIWVIIVLVSDPLGTIKNRKKSTN